MIETTVDYVDGVQFISNVRILESDDKYDGVPVHRIDWKVEDNATELMKELKLLGLRKVGEDPSCRESLYTQGYRSYIVALTVKILFRVNWSSVRWLYDNARFFKQIPLGTMFSWRYFTPYTWFKGLPK